MLLSAKAALPAGQAWPSSKRVDKRPEKTCPKCGAKRRNLGAHIETAVCRTGQKFALQRARGLAPVGDFRRGEMLKLADYAIETHATAHNGRTTSYEEWGDAAALAVLATTSGARRSVRLAALLLLQRGGEAGDVIRAAGAAGALSDADVIFTIVQVHPEVEREAAQRIAAIHDNPDQLDLV
jgi:hypothetical protein